MINERPDPTTRESPQEAASRRAFAAIRAETQVGTAQVLSSRNGLRFWYSCTACGVRSIRETFIREEAVSWGMRHDKELHGA